MYITLITLLLAAAGFVWGRIRADIVALVALLILTLSGILTTQEAPKASSVIDAGDILFIRGPRANVERFVADYSLHIADDNNETRRNLDFYDIGLAEIVIMPNSGIQKETIAQLDFRNVLVMPAGQYSFLDYVKVGAPLQLLLGLLMILTIPLFFPF